MKEKSQAFWDDYGPAFIVTAVVVVIVAIVAWLLFGTQGGQRMLKSISSNAGGGLERTVTVYDYSGNEIKSYSGKFDVSESENEVYFDDENGKCVIIHGGIVINEEK
jgi:hypothetical protein